MRGLEFRGNHGDLKAQIRRFNRLAAVQRENQVLGDRQKRSGKYVASTYAA